MTSVELDAHIVILIRVIFVLAEVLIKAYGGHEWNIYKRKRLSIKKLRVPRDFTVGLLKLIFKH